MKNRLVVQATTAVSPAEIHPVTAHCSEAKGSQFAEAKKSVQPIRTLLTVIDFIPLDLLRENLSVLVQLALLPGTLLRDLVASDRFLIDGHEFQKYRLISSANPHIYRVFVCFSYQIALASTSRIIVNNSFHSDQYCPTLGNDRKVLLMLLTFYH